MMKNNETSHGRRSFLKLLGLGGAAAAATAAGSTVLGGTVKKLTEDEDKGALWTTATFDDGVVRMRDDSLHSLLEKKPSKEAKLACQEMVSDGLHRDFHPDAPGRVCVLSVSGDYSQGYSKSMTWFGRRPKLGELVRFRGADPVYTVIEVNESERKRSNKWHNVLLDRPLELAVKDRTTVYGEGQATTDRKAGSVRRDRHAADIIIDGVTIAGAVTITVREDRPTPQPWLDDHAFDLYAKSEYLKDVTLDIEMTWIQGSGDLSGVLMQSGCIEEINVTECGKKQGMRFKNCYPRVLSQDTVNGCVTYDFTCEEVFHYTTWEMK